MERKMTKLAEKKISVDPIPLDLIPEILIGLPVKTLTRLLCVSKQYASIIRNRDFIKSYLIMSCTRPQSLIFTLQGKSQQLYLFSLQPQNRGESSSSSVAIYHMQCHPHPNTNVAPSVHGLICYGPPSKLMVYNPSTRRSITFPKIDSQSIDMYHSIGYDPIGGTYKVLSMVKGMHVHRRCGLARELRVLTLGKGNSWRMLEDFPTHFLGVPDCPDICIDGVLYYGALLDIEAIRYGVMSFDVRSEKFNLIKVPETAWINKMGNYNGKLAIILSSSFSANGLTTCRISMWVLVDAAKHEWSKKDFVVDLWMNEFLSSVKCLTDAGEFVLSLQTTLYKAPFKLVFYDPKKNAVRRVFIKGITERKHPLCDKVYTISIVPCQVENLMFL